MSCFSCPRDWVLISNASLLPNSHQGQVGAALVLGGVDSTGAHLFTVAPHGSTDKLPYVTMGSGSLAAMAVFESQWVKDLSVRIIYSVFVLRILSLESHV